MLDHSENISYLSMKRQHNSQMEARRNGKGVATTCFLTANFWNDSG